MLPTHKEFSLKDITGRSQKKEEFSLRHVSYTFYFLNVYAYRLCWVVFVVVFLYFV